MIPPTLVPSAAGPNLQREVSTLTSLLESPQRPFVAIVGGAKVAEKLGIVKVLAQKADTVIVGRRHGLHVRVQPGSQHRIVTL
jgi:3-phosphoglycerate kinase